MRSLGEIDTCRLGPMRKHMLPIESRFPRVKQTAKGAGLPNSNSVRRMTEKLHTPKRHTASIHQKNRIAEASRFRIINPEASWRVESQTKFPEK